MQKLYIMFKNYKSGNYYNDNFLSGINFILQTNSYFFYKNKIKSSYLVLFLSAFLFLTDAFAQSPSVFTASGTWVCPQGVTSIQVEAWGGGAGGITTPNSNNTNGGGGGGGAYARRNAISVIPGTPYTITVGTGGGASTAGNISTATINGITLTAAGGSIGNSSTSVAGTGGLGGTVALSSGDVVFRGGNGANGTFQPAGNNSGNGGGGGSGAGSLGNGNDGTGTTAGALRSNFGGAGGNGGASGFSAPIIAGNYGGGGGGAGHKNNIGGSGRNGAIIITFSCPVNTISAGPNQTLAACATTATLSGSTVTAGTGTWTLVSGTATITAINSPTSGITGIVSGTPVVLRWTINNGRCGTGFSDVTITSPVGPGCLNYCAPVHTVSCNTPITDVTFNTISNTTGCANTNAMSYTNYALGGTPTTSLLIGSAYNLSVSTGATAIVSAWIDLNQNGTFEASEWTQVYTTGTTGIVSILIPFGSTAGITRLRIRSRVAGNPNAAGDSCTFFSSGETEDYAITLIAPSPCVTPTAQPTAMNLTSQGTIISGSFVASSPVANGYLVVISTNATPPSPVNTTNYAIGATIGAGYTVIDNDSNTGFSATGLTNSTLYYIYVFSFNNLCSGGPLYMNTSPLTLNISTTTNTYCIPTSLTSTRFIQDVSTTGYITNISNLGSGRATSGYTDFTALPPVTQIAGGGVTLDYRLVNSRQFVKVWVDWNNDGIFTDGAPELAYSTTGILTIAGSAGFVVPGATPIGNYRIRIRSFEAAQAFTPCDVNLATGETEDYRLVVVADCTAKITSVVDGSRCDAGTVNVTTNGSAGTTQYRFYNTRTGGTLIGTSATTTFTTPSITVTTSYFVTAFNGTCESLYREEVKAIVNPTTTINVTPSAPEVCGENNIVSVQAVGDVIIDNLLVENFEAGGFGVLNLVNVSADANTQWTNRTSPYVPTGSVWKPAITSRSIGNRFALSVSDFAAPTPKDTQLRTANLNTTAYSTLFLNFRHYFSYYVGEPLQFADVDVSVNGGVAWTNIARYTSTQGYAGEFNDVIIDASAYAGLPQVMFRFRYQLQGSAFCDGWAIDDVKVYGTRPLNTTFTWSGGAIATFVDAACTIPYVAQTVTTIYVRPAGAQINASSWSFTANATLGNGCPVSKNIVINNKTRTWLGNNSNWNDPNNWIPNGVPSIDNCVLIPSSSNQSILSIGPAGAGKNLEIKNGGILEVNTNNSLTIKESINIISGGNFTIRNNSSLIQIDNFANTYNGTFTYERTAPAIKGSDYVYWSSPVLNQDISTLYSTPLSGPKYQWNTTAINANGGLGSWETSGGIMSPAKGYIMRGSSNYALVSTNLNAVFTGAPNNGDLIIKGTRGDMEPANVGPVLAYPNPALNAWDDNWTLVGNPYPSAINALQFLATNSVELMGNVRLWRHLSDPAIIASPFYQTFVYNYNSNDYLTINYTGATTPGASDIIKSGQAFLVQRREGPLDLTGIDVNFNNQMRLTPTNTVMDNSGFFRANNQNQNTTSILEKHRIWLDIVDGTTNASETTLVGYINGATANFDSDYDATIGTTGSIGIYSFTDNQKCIIQGKALPFLQQDTVPVGINVQTNGQYHIAIKAVDGLFSGAAQNIYLEDKLLNVFHDLRANPYSFTAVAGTHNDRFVLQYASQALTTTDFVKTNDIKIFANNKINISSPVQSIIEIKVFDILGKLLYTKTNIKSNDVILNEFNQTNNVLIVKVTLENKQEVTKKVIF